MSSIKDLDFPKSCGKDDWETYLCRELTNTELFILEDAKSEKLFNNRLVSLAHNAKEKNLYIPTLTNLHGNCLFESLMHYKLFDDHDKFRKDLAYFMYIFGDFKNFFPNQSESLNELFQLTNEIEYVYCKKDNKMYKYTYKTMCIDLFTEFSWTRLPTQIIMMVMSYLFNAKLFTVSNATDHNKNNYISEICNTAENNPMEIYLGHIGEIHYVPLDKVPDGTNFDTLPILKYNNAKLRFYHWAITMAKSLKQKHIKDEEQKEKEKENNDIKPQFKSLPVDDNTENHVTFA